MPLYSVTRVPHNPLRLMPLYSLRVMPHSSLRLMPYYPLRVVPRDASLSTASDASLSLRGMTRYPVRAMPDYPSQVMPRYPLQVLSHRAIMLILIYKHSCTRVPGENLAKVKLKHIVYVAKLLRCVLKLVLHIFMGAACFFFIPIKYIFLS